MHTQCYFCIHKIQKPGLIGKGVKSWSRRGVKPRAKASILPLGGLDWAAPGHLSSIARGEFERVRGLLEQRGVLGFTDPALVARRAEVVELAVSASKQLEQDGPFVESDRGNVSSHPGAKLLIQCSLALRHIDHELGLTPKSAGKKSAAGEASGGSDGYSHWVARLKGGGA